MSAEADAALAAGSIRAAPSRVQDLARRLSHLRKQLFADGCAARRSGMPKWQQHSR